ncbi:hypothetical protein CMV_021917 [Castanea mollissima]|uniref:G3BP-like protein n=1 Tax=Castanea mollissima TaxID=60419 RepID=A0A8J4QET9_9ROSI|nr:hypothetical protein CMV_021917 [Castanea mollissima]
MATPFPIPVTAAQVGTYFVGQYYQVLQNQPEFVHQFYSEASTMIRIDGNNRDTASAMLQIHALVMSLSYTGIEIKTAYSLESWNGGVLVMVSGSVQVKDFSGKRKFVETFFLAPQEKGYFVLNDIFHFIDDEPVLHHPAVILAESNLESKLNAPTTIPDPVSNYLLGGEVQSREFMSPTENDAAESNGLLQNTVNAVQDHLPPNAEEPIGEPQKHTYASILRVAKGQPTQAVASQPSANKNMPLTSEWDHASQPTTQQSNFSSNAYERSVAEAAEEVPIMEDEGEIRSVYVRNLPPTVSASEIEEEFKNFGTLSDEGVVVRSRKDVGVCYAFVEFEDMTGVQNAIKAGSLQIAGRQVYIEERRPNSNIPSRGARRGRGRGIYQSDAPRGRFGSRSYGRGSGYDVGDRDYNRPRGNGFYRPGPRPDRGFSGQQVSRSGHNPSEPFN